MNDRLFPRRMKREHAIIAPVISKLDRDRSAWSFRARNFLAFGFSTALALAGCAGGTSSQPSVTPAALLSPSPTAAVVGRVSPEASPTSPAMASPEASPAVAAEPSPKERKPPVKRPKVREPKFVAPEPAEPRLREDAPVALYGMPPRDRDGERDRPAPRPRDRSERPERKTVLPGY